MVVLGLLLGLVGTDVNSGIRRFNFGMTGLADGIEFVALSMAIYGIAEVAYNLEKKEATSVVSGAIGRVWPSLGRSHALHAGSILRGTVLGSLLGVLPGGGALLASFARLYAREEGRQAAAQVRPRRHPRRRGAGIRQQCRRADLVHPDADARHPRQSDHGDDDRRADDPRHRAGPARDDRPAGIVLGPDRQHVDRQSHAGGAEPAAWSACGCRLLRVPYRLLFPAIIVFCCIGAYIINSKPFDAVRDGVLHGLRLPRAQARLRAGAAHPRLRARDR